MMQRILAKKTVSMTDMRDPKKVLEFADGEPVAVMNRNKVVSYNVPADAVEMNTITYATKEEVEEMTQELLREHADVLEYLKDK